MNSPSPFLSFDTRCQVADKSAGDERRFSHFWSTLSSIPCMPKRKLVSRWGWWKVRLAKHALTFVSPCGNRTLIKTQDYLEIFARFKEKENIEAVERLLSAHTELELFERSQLGNLPSSSPPYAFPVNSFNFASSVANLSPNNRESLL